MLAALLERARAEPGVRVVRASISPHNVASLATIASFGFVHVGEQWDDHDGRELLYELGVAAPGQRRDGGSRCTTSGR
jgi:RimJ/RimL family protein N-acetyltransferase